MKETSLIELPEETVERNLSYLRGQNGSQNRLLERTYNGQGRFSEEVHDLFYFFNGFGKYVKRIVRTPKLREGHNQRLGELEQVLNNVDLMTLKEAERYSTLTNLKRTLDNVGNSFTSKMVDHRALYYFREELKYYEGLKGELDTKPLHEEELQKHLRSMTKFNIGFITVPLLISIGGSAYAYTWSNDSRDVHLGLMLGTVSFVSLMIGIVGNEMKYEPPSYSNLDRKADRLDKFVQRYMK